MVTKHVRHYRGYRGITGSIVRDERKKWEAIWAEKEKSKAEKKKQEVTARGREKKKSGVSGELN